jgi:hypothetical protein
LQASRSTACRTAYFKFNGLPCFTRSCMSALARPSTNCTLTSIYMTCSTRS